MALASAVAAPSREMPRVCSIITPPLWARADTVSYVILRARSDTLPATMWRPPMIRLGLPPEAPDPPPAAERVVYGQHVEILRAVGPAAQALATLGGRDSAALIAWRMNSMCSLHPPYPTVVLDPGDEVFLATLPRRDARARFASLILDKTAGRRFYDPVLEREYHSGKRWWLRPAVMSVEEFEAFYNALPPASLWEADPRRALAQLQQWATTHSTLARREPARSILKEARNAVRELHASRPGA